MNSLTQTKFGRIFFNTTIYKAVTVIALMLSPMFPFCFFPQPISVVLLTWGALILLRDLFTERHFMKAPYSIFLFGFVVTYCITLVFFLKDDLLSTFNVFFWMILEFFLLYAFTDTKDFGGILEEIRKINVPISVVSTVVAVLGIASILLRITVAMDDPEGLDRLWAFGIFGERNSGPYHNPIPLSSCLYIGTIASAWNLLCQFFEVGVKKSKKAKGYYIVSLILCYICQQTTFTRSYVFGTYFTLCIAAFITAFFLLKNKKKIWVRLVAGVGAVAVTAGVLLGSYAVLKLVIPAIANTHEARVYFVGETVDNKSEEELIKSLGLKTDVTMERKQFGESYVGPRENIWRVALDVIPHSPFLGFTSGNRPATSLEYDTTGYCEVGFPEGIPTYHNAYLDIAVSAGLIGVAWMLVFLGVLIVRSLINLFSDKTDLNGKTGTHYGLLVGAAATHVFFVSNCFGVLVFNNICTCLYFWILLGFLARANEILSGKENKSLKISTWFDRFFRKEKKGNE